MSQIGLQATEIVALRDLPTAPDARPASEVVASQSGAIAAVDEGAANLPAASILTDPYVGVSAIPFDDRAQEVLAKYAVVPDDWIDIRPEGLIYLSHMKARRILNGAFQYGGWSIVPVGEFRREEKGNHIILYRTYRLYVSGRFVGEVEAAGDYWTNNPSQNYADAAEACQSYALNRLSKNFGIASQCWDKAYAETWKSKYAETFVKDGKTQWRKRTDNKIGAESSAVTPNDHPQQTPTPQPSATPSSSDSAPKSSLSIITIASNGKAWSHQGVRYAVFTDTEGNKWKFQGDTVKVAEGSITLALPIEIEWRTEVEGKYRSKVVTNAAVVEAS